MQKLDKLDLPLLDFPLESDETPTTAISTLPHIPTPLPPAESRSYYIVGIDSGWENQGNTSGTSADAARHPQAPLLKDLDSFTDGTGKGSFDSILDDYPYEQGGDLFCHPNSLELLPALEPTTPLNIESWREEVSGHAPEPYDDLAADDVEFADADGDLEPAADFAGYEPGSPVSPRAPMLSPRGSPRASKRSRSRSPGPSRRIRARPRSKSLSSIKSLTYQILDGLSARPWGTFLEPFD